MNTWTEWVRMHACAQVEAKNKEIASETQLTSLAEREMVSCHASL